MIIFTACIILFSGFMYQFVEKTLIKKIKEEINNKTENNKSSK